MAAILRPWPAGDVDADAPQWKRLEALNFLLGQWTDNATLATWKAQTGTVRGRVGEREVEHTVDEAMALALNHYVATAQVLPAWAEARQIERAEVLLAEGDDGSLRLGRPLVMLVEVGRHARVRRGPHPRAVLNSSAAPRRERTSC